MASIHDFGDGNGPVPAHRHLNGGGWVADTATVAASACVGLDAKVYGNARVSDNANVYQDACISDNACVYGNAWVSDNANVGDNAKVYGNARVGGDTWVYDNAKVHGDAQVFGNARVFGKIFISHGRHSGSDTQPEAVLPITNSDSVPQQESQQLPFRRLVAPEQTIP